VNEARQSQTPRRTGDTVARECTAAGSRITLHDEASFSNVEMTRYTPRHSHETGCM